ncbi:MAG: hypothetical protein KDA53_09835 [Hyphomonas sp.]|nr:hypothetical protein [Hyphomonas sp.]
MPALMEAWNADVAAQPQWVQVWMNVMVAVLALGGLAFSFVRVEARWVLASFVAGAAGLFFIYSQMGYVRLLGLGHVLFWTPALVYLLRRRDTWRVRETWSGKWIAIAAAVMTISLAFDYADVIRWGLGERG